MLTNAPYPPRNYYLLVRQALLVISAGIVGWTVFLVFALASSADSRYIYTALVGIALGFIGIRYTIKRGKRERI